MVNNPSQTNSSRRRVSSYLRSTQHRLSSLAGSNDSTSPAAPPTTDPDILQPPPRTPPSPSTEAPPSTRCGPDPSDEPLSPPNPLSTPLTSALPTQAVQADAATTTSPVNTPVGGISRIMARHRSTSQSLRRSISESATATITSTALNGPSHELPSIRLVPHQDSRANRPSLAFPPMARTLPSDDSIIRVGRYSERDAVPNPPPNVPSAAPVGFKSKVVSRKHCEFWCQNGQWYIKDVKSSSGTFLNHIRLSQPSLESRPFPVKDGDVVQLGIDFRGGEEMIFRCVKIRVECNRGWQKALNSFNVATHKRLLGKPHLKKDADADATSAQSSECAICLMSIAPCQALFVAPCSHVWHYKCIRPILNDHKTFPSFLCPNCRAVADLDADVDDPDAMNDWEDDEDSSGSVEGPKEAPVVNGTSPEAVQRALDEEDKSLATATTRQLSVRNGIDPPPESAEYTGVDAPPPSRSALSPTADRGTASSSLPNLLHRRHTQGIMPPRHMPLPSTAEGQAVTIPLSQHAFLRPITPSQSLLADGDFLSREAMMGDAMTPGSELGPMTPTNNAGPFVFDGSAGRDSIHRPTASSPEIPDEVRSKA
ncbi:MAG: hypothetical protein L6R38_000631 [Xanthoria sp. 2 TBL-2021]|nr:MAG: hypothetical protein L6R38_000631 [Xanthoria sp. 2 TBL-2021]